MYVTLDKIAAGLKALLVNSGAFKSVLFSAATNAGQARKELELLTKLPGAIVFIGDIRYRDNGASRVIRPMIICACPFRRSCEEKSLGVWDLAEIVQEIFTIGYDGTAPPAWTAVEEIDWQIDAIEPLDSDLQNELICITLSGFETL